MNARLFGKRVIVTGAAQGMGRAIAVEAARQGAESVTIVDLKAAEAEETAELVRTAGARALVAVADLTKSADIRRLVDRDWGAHGGRHAARGIGVAAGGVGGCPAHRVARRARRERAGRGRARLMDVGRDGHRCAVADGSAGRFGPWSIPRGSCRSARTVTPQAEAATNAA